MAWRKLGFLFGMVISMPWSIASEPTLGDRSAKRPSVMIVLGAEGEPEYGVQFRAWGERWMRAFSQDQPELIDGTQAEAKNSPISHRQMLLDWIEWTNKSDSAETRWLVFLGHGTSDRDACKFNLAGPDISATELAESLKGSRHRWVIVSCFSSSGPFLSALSGEGRIVITATKSGAEQNYSRFGDYFSRAITDPRSDLDHDGSVSVLEAFLAASNGVARFYQEGGRLASEQALLDDNQDKRGTPASFFRGIQAVKAPADGLQLDGKLARQIPIATLGQKKPVNPENLKQAEQIEIQIDELRKKKQELSEDDYYQRLEELLARLAELLIGM